MVLNFIFLRHGEAEHNVAFHQLGESVFQDPKYKDPPLTEKGKQQIRDVAEKLRDYPILDIWSSPLTRCIQTTDELFEELDIGTIYLHDSLLERLGGGHVCNERKSKQELKKHCFYTMTFLPELPPFWAERENETSLYHRLNMFVLGLSEMYKKVTADVHILIVGHGDALSCLTRKPFKNGEFVIMNLEEIQAAR